MQLRDDGADDGLTRGGAGSWNVFMSILLCAAPCLILLILLDQARTVFADQRQMRIHGGGGRSLVPVPERLTDGHVSGAFCG